MKRFHLGSRRSAKFATSQRAIKWILLAVVILTVLLPATGMLPYNPELTGSAQQEDSNALHARTPSHTWETQVKVLIKHLNPRHFIPSSFRPDFEFSECENQTGQAYDKCLQGLEVDDWHHDKPPEISRSQARERIQGTRNIVCWSFNTDGFCAEWISAANLERILEGRVLRCDLYDSNKTCQHWMSTSPLHDDVRTNKSGIVIPSPLSLGCIAFNPDGICYLWSDESGDDSLSRRGTMSVPPSQSCLLIGDGFCINAGDNPEESAQMIRVEEWSTTHHNQDFRNSISKIFHLEGSFMTAKNPIRNYMNDEHQNEISQGTINQKLNLFAESKPKINFPAHRVPLIFVRTFGAFFQPLKCHPLEEGDQQDCRGGIKPIFFVYLFLVVAGVCVLLLAILRCLRVFRRRQAIKATKSQATRSALRGGETLKPAISTQEMTLSPERCNVIHNTSKTGSAISTSNGGVKEGAGKSKNLAADGTADGWAKWIRQQARKGKSATLSNGSATSAQVSAPRLPSLKLPKAGFSTVRKHVGIGSEGRSDATVRPTVDNGRREESKV